MALLKERIPDLLKQASLLQLRNLLRGIANEYQHDALMNQDNADYKTWAHLFRIGFDRVDDKINEVIKAQEALNKTLYVSEQQENN